MHGQLSDPSVTCPAPIATSGSGKRSRVCRMPMAQMRQLRERYPQLECMLLQRTSIELAAAQDTELCWRACNPANESHICCCA